MKDKEKEKKKRESKVGYIDFDVSAVIQLGRVFVIIIIVLSVIHDSEKKRVNGIRKKDGRIRSTFTDGFDGNFEIGCRRGCYYYIWCCFTY